MTHKNTRNFFSLIVVNDNDINFQSEAFVNHECMTTDEEYNLKNAHAVASIIKVKAVDTSTTEEKKRISLSQCVTYMNRDNMTGTRQNWQAGLNQVITHGAHTLPLTTAQVSAFSPTEQSHRHKRSRSSGWRQRCGENETWGFVTYSID